MQKKNFKKVVPYALMLAIVGVGTYGAFTASNSVSAFFTDKQEKTVNGKAGTLQLKLTDNTENGNLDPDNDGIINPGDYKNIRFNVANTAEKSMDLRAVFILKSAGPIENEDGAPPKYWPDAQNYYLVDHVNLSNDSADVKYPAVESVEELNQDENAAGKNYRLIKERTIDKYTKEYTIDLGTLNGSVETEDGITKTADNYSFQFYFDRMASNNMIGDDVTLSYTVYGLQHRNAQEGDWDSLLKPASTLDVDMLMNMISDNSSEITAFRCATGAAPETSEYVSMDDTNPIYANYADTVLTVYTDDDKLDVVDYMDGLFADCVNLTDISGLSKFNTAGAISANEMFRGCTKLTDLTPLSDWDMSGIEDADEMFRGCTSLSNLKPLSNWDVSNINNMYGMFAMENDDGQALHNTLTDISALKDWTLCNGADLARMFAGTNISDVSAIANWNVNDNGEFPCYTNLMFKGCSNLTDATSLENWGVTTGHAIGMFDGTNITKDKLPSWYDTNISIDGYNLRNIIEANKDTIQAVKYSADEAPTDAVNVAWEGDEVFAKMVGNNLTIYSTKDTLYVKDSRNFSHIGGELSKGLFQNCVNLTDIEALRKWDVSYIDNMENMFNGCTNLSDISALDTWVLGKFPKPSTEAMFGGTAVTSYPTWYTPSNN